MEENDKKEEVKKSLEPENVKITVVDFTAFNSRRDEVFFKKSMEEIRFELSERCNTVVIHKTTEYEVSLVNKTETMVDKVVEVDSVYEENVFALLKARKNMINVSKRVINKKTAEKLLKVSDKLDDIILHEKMD